MWIDDQILANCHLPLALKTWVPTTSLVVLGSSNQSALEVDEQFCQAQHVPILRRYGGGGTVVLYPGCAVVSLGMWVKRDFHNQFYFKLLNQALIETLEAQGVEPGALTQDGMSDVVYGARKLVGTSLFRSRNYLLYQASILVAVDFDLIASCLRHPSREPDYRRGRTHEEFLLGVADLLEQATPQTVSTGLEVALPAALASVFGDEMIEPQPTQFKNILARAARGSGSPQA